MAATGTSIDDLDATLTDKVSHTAREITVEDGHIETLQLAMNNGAKLDAHTCNLEGDTLLDCAINKENKDAISLLLKHVLLR